MAFELKTVICEGCKRITFYDVTKPYNASTNPGGYGQSGLPANPNQFQTYTLQVWAPGQDRNGDPSYTVNLLGSPLVAAVGPCASCESGCAEDTYPMVITAESLGLTTFVSGAWRFITTATYILPDTTTATYTHQVDTALIQDIKDLVKNAVLGVNVENGDWAKAGNLMNRLEAACYAAGCGQLEHATALVDWLYDNYRTCC